MSADVTKYVDQTLDCDRDGNPGADRDGNPEKSTSAVFKYKVDSAFIDDVINPDWIDGDVAAVGGIGLTNHSLTWEYDYQTADGVIHEGENTYDDAGGSTLNALYSVSTIDMPCDSLSQDETLADALYYVYFTSISASDETVEDLYFQGYAGAGGNVGACTSIANNQWTCDTTGFDIGTFEEQ